MTEEFNFKNLCNLTTKILGLPNGSLASKSKKKPLQVARAVAGYIALTEEDIHRTVIAKVLNRDRSLIYHYERTHESNYATKEPYRNIFNKIYKAHKDIAGTKKLFVNKDVMKTHLLKNGVVETLTPDVLLSVNSGQVECIIKTSYYDFSNVLKKIKTVMRDYHFTIKII